MFWPHATPGVRLTVRMSSLYSVPYFTGSQQSPLPPRKTGMMWSNLEEVLVTMCVPPVLHPLEMGYLILCPCTLQPHPPDTLTMGTTLKQTNKQQTSSTMKELQLHSFLLLGVRETGTIGLCGSVKARRFMRRKGNSQLQRQDGI